LRRCGARRIADDYGRWGGGESALCAHNTHSKQHPTRGSHIWSMQRHAPSVARGGGDSDISTFHGTVAAVAAARAQQCHDAFGDIVGPSRGWDTSPMLHTRYTEQTGPIEVIGDTSTGFGDDAARARKRRKILQNSMRCTILVVVVCSRGARATTRERVRLRTSEALPNLQKEPRTPSLSTDRSK